MIPARILLMARELNLGGTERQLAETARSLDRARFDPRVGVFYPGGVRYDDLRAAGVPLLEVPVRSFRKPSVFSAAAGLVRYIRQERIALVHTFDPPLNAFGVPVARLAGGVRVLASARGSRQLVSPIMRRWLRLTDRMADGVVVNCLAMQRELIADGGVAPARIHLCYNALDTAVFFPDRVSNKVPVIGCVCAQRVEKGLDTLLRAFARLPRNGPPAELLLVGDGPARAEIEALARSLDLGSRIHFEPGTNNVVPWLQRIDIFVLPSRSEALSNSLMEAMACGCSPIASRAGGNPELVTDGETGLLYPVGDDEALAASLARLLGDDTLRRRLAAAAAHRIAGEFSLAAAARRMGEIYETVLNYGNDSLSRAESNLTL